VAGLAAAFGSGAMTNTFREIEDANCIFVIGSNTTIAHPLVATRIYRAKAKGAKLIVADPRRIHLARFADIYVQPRSGTNVALINGIMHVIYKEGWYNKEFIEERTENFEAFVEVIEKYPPSLVSRITDVPEEDIVKIAEYYARSEASSIIYCMGITQHTTGVDNVKSLANLAMLCGHVGRPSTGVNPLRGQNNVQGACDVGGLPNVYPGYQAVNVPANKEKFEKAWGVSLSSDVGLTVVEMTNAVLEGKLKALVVMAENPMVSDPNTHHIEEALRKVELLAVIDIFPTPTTELAHVVLPGVSFAEKDGTFTNSERRVQKVRKAIEPIGEGRVEWAIFQDLANRLGYPMNYASSEDVFNELASLTPSYGGISYERLDREPDGLIWPCPTPDHPGTPILHRGQFARGKGLFHAIEYKGPAEEIDSEYPFWLTTGRVYVHYHTGTMTRRSIHLVRELNEPYMEIHPHDAAQLGISNGEMVRLESRRGAIETRAIITDSIKQGLIFMPFHFAEAAANRLTNAALDPVAKIPEFKVCAVRVVKLEEETTEIEAAEATA
jgi:formate dehydrogenase alpha subunit